MQSIKDGNDVSRLAGIVSEERSRLIGKRPNDGDPPNARLERKNAIILQQDHGLIRQLAGVCAMFRTVEFLLVDFRVGHHVRGIKHAEPDRCGEQSNQRSIEVAFGKIALLNRIDVGFLQGFTKSRGKGDALVVHATNYGHRAPLRLRRAIAVIGGDISDGITVRDHVSLKAPLAAQLVLQQILTRARRLAIDRVVGTHHRPCFTFDHGRAECRFVRVYLIVLANVHVGKVARRFWAAVHSVVLEPNGSRAVLAAQSLFLLAHFGAFVI